MGKVAITGIGLATPVGNDVQTFWNSLLGGRSGIRRLRLLDQEGLATCIGGAVDDEELDRVLAPEAKRRMSRASQLAVVAAKRAVDDAGLVISDGNRGDIDVCMGVATPDVVELSKSVERRLKRGGRGVSPYMPAVAVNSAPVGNVVSWLGVTGEAITVCTGCSSSTNAIGQAYRRIRDGLGSIVLAGGADVGIQPDLVAAYCNAKALSERNDEPERACRPFEAHRDGHVLSEAAGLLILENYESAVRRGARIYAELCGYGATCDRDAAFQVNESIESASRCVQKTLAESDWTCEPQYYCAHGSSSRLTDTRETRTLKAVFGRKAYSVPISSIKSMTGHPFGASGSLQTAAAAMAIHTGSLPPTINYEDPDPECDLDYVPNEARQEKAERALVYSLGMGGNNAALALQAC